MEVQNSMVERNAGLPSDQRIDFRIGIHLGDVVEESDGDLMGDGVNIAARLEGIAKPGAICLSEDAYRQVKARLDLSVRDLGATMLKNIAEPIRVYALEVGAPPLASPTSQSKRVVRTRSTAWPRLAFPRNDTAGFSEIFSSWHLAHQKSGSFPPPALPGFNGRISLSDSRQSRCLSRR